MSESDSLREKANEIYSEALKLKKATKNDEALDQFLEAISLYRDAIDEAENEKESSFAYKNMGQAYSRVYELKNQEKYMMHARKCYLTAIKEGAKAQSQDWLEKIGENIIELAGMCSHSDEQLICFYLQVYNSKNELLNLPSLVYRLTKQLAVYYLSKAIEKRDEILKIEKGATSNLTVEDVLPKMKEYQNLIFDLQKFNTELEILKYSDSVSRATEWNTSIRYEEETWRFFKHLINAQVSFNKEQYWDALDIMRSYLANMDTYNPEKNITLYEARAQYEIARALTKIDEKLYDAKIRELLTTSIGILVSNGINHDNYWHTSARNLLIYFQNKSKINNDKLLEEERNEMLENPEYKTKLEKLNKLVYKERMETFIKKVFEFFPNPDSRGKNECPADEELKKEKLKTTLIKSVIPVYSQDLNQSGKYPKALYLEISQLLIHTLNSLKDL